jgi:hypothetical protein
MTDVTNVEVLGQILVVLNSIAMMMKGITAGVFFILGWMIGSTVFKR